MKTSIETYRSTKIIFLAAALVTMSLADARTIWFVGDHHEQLTYDAMYCADQLMPNEESCPPRPEDWKGEIDLSKVGLGKFTLAHAKNAVRYPDDPVRELRWWNLPGLVRWTWRIAVDACGSSDRIIDVKNGLRCSSHYGPLQFLHAMEEKENVEPEVTRNKMSAWITFALDVAQNKSNSEGVAFINQDYCSYWLASDSAIAEFMVPEADEFPCVKKGDPWTLGTIFSFDCRFKISSCWTDSDEQIRRRAIGAVLHLIQDSHSQGHSARGGCCGTTKTTDLAKFECAPIERFFVYKGQDRDRHTAADKAPIAGSSCNKTTEIHGPVLAAAHVLRMLSENVNRNQIVDYLNNHVIKTHVEAGLSSSTIGFDLQ